MLVKEIMKILHYLSLEQIGKRVGNKSVSAVSNTLRILKLPSYVCDELIKGSLSEGQARSLVGLDDKTIKQVLPLIISEQWNVRKVEQFIVNLKKNATTDKSLANKIHDKPYLVQLERIQSHLKTDVNIRTNARGAGLITIKFKDEKEFERLQKLLA